MCLKPVSLKHPILIFSPDMLILFSETHRCNLTGVIPFTPLPCDGRVPTHTRVVYHACSPLLPSQADQPLGVLHPSFGQNGCTPTMCWSGLWTAFRDNRKHTVCQGRPCSARCSTRGRRSKLPFSSCTYFAEAELDRGLGWNATRTIGRAMARGETHQPH